MKKDLSIPLALALFFLSIEMDAQTPTAQQQQKVNQLFKKTKTVYFKFPVTSSQEVAPLSKIIVVDKTKGNMVFAHANKDAFSKFIVKNYSYVVVPHAGGSTPATSRIKKK